MRRQTWFAFALGALCALGVGRLFEAWPEAAGQSPEPPRETPIGPPW